jgi:hypothetical protein
VGVVGLIRESPFLDRDKEKLFGNRKKKEKEGVEK